jgi:hypothetical protein
LGRRASFVVLAGLAIAGAAWGIGALLRPPAFLCSTPDREACTNTRNSVLYERDLVFPEPLPARLLTVDVRPAPPEWTSLPGYFEGSWAALLTLERGDPLLVACYYHSDDMVTCNLPDAQGNPY